MLDNERAYSLKLNEGQFKRLDAVRHRTGVLVSEQIRRAIEAWLQRQETTHE